MANGIKIGSLNIDSLKVGSGDCIVYLGDTLLYSGSTPPTPPDYLAFRALEDGTFQLSRNSINYSLDSGSTWNTLASGTSSPTVQSGQTIMWKGALAASDSNGIGTFSSSGQFEVEGNIMSLRYGDNFIGQTVLTDNYAFCKLFSGCTGLTSAENLVLPATTLSEDCYSSMFDGCTNLTAAPELSATTLAIACYNSMFYNCRSLNTSPILPATTLVNFCYRNMFMNCTSLNSITCLATDISASNCTFNWVRSVGYVGTFYKAASMNNWDVDANGVPVGWALRDYQQ